MNHKLLLSLLVGSMTCALTAAVDAPKPAPVVVAQASRLAQLRNAATTATCKTGSVVLNGLGYVGDATFYGLNKGQGIYNYGVTTRPGKFAHDKVVALANNRQAVGTLVTALTLYGFNKTTQAARLKRYAKVSYRNTKAKASDLINKASH